MGGRSYGGWGRGRLYTYRYTVTTRMMSALRWAARRAILMFRNCEGQSDKTVSTDLNLWSERRAEADSNRGPFAFRPTALLEEHIPLVEFIYLVFIRMPGNRRCASCGVYTLYLPACQVASNVPLVEFMYLVFTRMPGNRRCTSCGVYVPCIYPHAMLQAMYLWWCLYTLYLPACQVTGDVRLVEFMYLVFTRMPGNRRCTSGDVYVPCIYSHAMLQAMYLWWGLCTCYLLACQVRFP